MRKNDIETLLNDYEKSKPNFNNIKHRIEYSNKRKKTNKTFFNYKKLAIPFSLIIILIISGLYIIKNYDFMFVDDLPDTKEISEYEKEQKRRANLYKKIDNNHYDEYVSSQYNENADAYKEYLLSQNEKNENEQKVEDIYYEITIDYCNGKTPQVVIMKKGEIIYPEVFSRSGYYFLGWFINGEELKSAYIVDADVRIYAKWAVEEIAVIAGNTYTYYGDENGVSIVRTNLKVAETIVVPTYLDGKKVTKLENGAFSGLYSQNRDVTKKIIVSEYVTEIRASVFCFYNELEEIVFPGELNVVFSNAFTGCYNLKKINTTSNDGNIYCDDNCLVDKRTNAVIIGTSESSIPNYIKIIEKYAFSDLYNLYSIDIPQSVEKIYDGAFKGCINIEKIVLPEKIKKIPTSLFLYCENLKEVYIGENVSEVGSLSFSGCKKLEKIIVSSKNKFFKSIDGCLVENEESKLIVGGKVNEIPKGVKIIARYAFVDRINVESIIIGNDVQLIEPSAFESCTGLKELIIQSNLQIKSSAFRDCSDLETILLEGNISSIGERAFENCVSLKEITIPESISIIEKSVFSLCKSLEKVVFLGVVTEIKETAFSSCSKLKYIDLSNVKIIGSQAFNFCTNLTDISLNSAEIIREKAFYRCDNLGEVIIPSTVNIIEDEAFARCTNSMLFCEDKEMKDTWSSIFSSGTTCYFGTKSAIESGDFVFNLKFDNTLELTMYRGSDVSLVIPSEVDGYLVTSINPNMFYLNDWLEEIVLSDNIEIIYKSTFQQCSNLKTVVLPRKLKEIENLAFFHCVNLNNVTFNEGLIKIGESAFGSCDLFSVTLPSTLQYIDKYAFSSNERLFEIYKLCNNVEIKGNNFEVVKIKHKSVTDASCFYLMDNYLFFKLNQEVLLVDYYGNNPLIELPKYALINGENFAYQISDYAFKENNNIVSINIPNTVTSIGNNAFYLCYSLVSITLPQNLDNIGDGCFSNCTNLFEIYNLSSLEIEKSSSQYGYIAYYAKYIYNSKLVPSKVKDGLNGFIYFVDGNNSQIVNYYGNDKVVKFPDNIEGFSYSIAQNCFKYNKNITNIELSTGVVAILKGAFSNCLMLKEVYIPSNVVRIESFAFNYCPLEKYEFEDPNNWAIYWPADNSKKNFDFDLSNPVQNALNYNRISYNIYNFVKDVKE